MDFQSIVAMLNASGTFPEESVVKSNFAALFKLAQEDRVSKIDLAKAFSIALDQLAHVDSRSTPEIADPVRRWVMSNWTTHPYDLCSKLCILLVTVRTPESLEFLVRQQDQTSDPDIKSLLNRYIKMH